MKKVLAIMLTLVLAFALCVPSFAEESTAAGASGLDKIIETVSNIIAQIGNGGITMPDISMPDVSMPDVSMPDVSMPDVSMPDVTIPDDKVVEAANQIISALRKAGVADKDMQDVVDQLHDRGTIPDNVYDEITTILNNAEGTTEAVNEGGIGGFIGGIVDKIKDLFNGGNTGGDEDPSKPANNDNYEGKEPTGDTAILSVAAVAAVAGVALVLTKKKEK